MFQGLRSIRPLKEKLLETWNTTEFLRGYLSDYTWIYLRTWAAACFTFDHSRCSRYQVAGKSRTKLPCTYARHEHPALRSNVKDIQDKTAWSGSKDWPRSNWMALQLCIDPKAEGLLRVACGVQGELQRFFHLKEIRAFFRDRTVSQTLSSLETRNKRDSSVSQSQWDLSKLADLPKLEAELGQFDMLQ